MSLSLIKQSAIKTREAVEVQFHALFINLNIRRKVIG